MIYDTGFRTLGIVHLASSSGLDFEVVLGLRF